jgi:hypothetical protein
MDTTQIEKESKEIESLVGQEGWKIAKQKLIDLIADTQDIGAIAETTPEQVLIELKSRKLARTVMLNWLRDIEGTANSINNTKQEITNSYIIYK